MTKAIAYTLLFIAWIAIWATVRSGWFALGIPIFILLWPLCFFLWTTINEPYCRVITRFGSLKRIIAMGYSLDETSGDKVESTPMESSVYPTPGRIVGRIHIGGLYLAGFFCDKVLKKEFSWVTEEEDEKGVKQIKIHNKEKLSQFYLGAKDYIVRAKQAEDKKKFRLDIKCLMMLEIVNPAKALFEVHDYLATTYSMVEAMLTSGTAKIDFVGEGEFDRQSFGDDIFESEEDRRKELQEKYGISVLSLAVREVDPPNEEDKRALGEPARKELQGRAAAAEAKGKAEAMITVAEAEGEVEFYERMGNWAHSKARSLGLKIEELWEVMKNQPEIQTEMMEYMEKLHHDIEMAERGARFELETNGGSISGSSGGSANPINISGDDLKQLLILWKKVQSGSAGGSGGPGSSGGGSGSVAKGAPLTEEQTKKIFGI